jgi:hypothetical protein
VSTDNTISLTELHNFIGGFWYHYDQADYPNMAAAFAADATYLSRSDSGACPFEESLAADLTGAAEIVPWLIEHRDASPYPLRHHTTNLHITGHEGDVTYARFYIFVNQITNFVPFAVSSGVTEVGVRRGGSSPSGLEFTMMSVILDVTNSEPLVGSGLPGAENTAANT